MRHLQGQPHSQTSLLPPGIEEYVPEDHSVRVINVFVDSLNVAEVGFDKARTVTTGRRPYPISSLPARIDIQELALLKHHSPKEGKATWV